MAATTHVAICPFPFASHPNSALLLARKMAARATDVHFTFFITPKAAGIYNIPIGKSEENVHFRRVDAGDDDGNSGTLPEEITSFMKAAGRNYRNSIDAAEKEVGIEVSCFASEGFLSSVVGEIAEEKAAKWVAWWSAGATSLAAHMYTLTLRRFVEDGIEAKGDTMDHYIPCFPAIYLSEIQAEVTHGDLSSGISQVLYNMSLKLPKADAVAVNSCCTLETSIITALNQEKFSHKLLCLGPFPFTMPSSSDTVDEDENGCIPWLDTQLSALGPSTVAYISFGTAVPLPSEELNALAKALECTGVPFLWALPKGFYQQMASSGRGKIVKWAPQTRVLHHKAVGAFVTHCGWKSIVESICAGVPLVCRPNPFAEQLLNKGLVERVWEIGVGVDGGRFTENNATKTIQMVLLGDEGRKMRKRIKELNRLTEEGARRNSISDFQKWMDIVASK